MQRLLTGAAFCLAVTLPFAGSALADNLTDVTKKLLTEMKLGEEVMNGLDAELAIPADWIDKAKAEPGPLRIRWNVDELAFQPIWDLFAARYPFIEKEFLFATGADASTQPLMAFTQGTLVMDVANTIGREHANWREANGFEELSDLPAIASQVPGGFSEDKLTAAYSTNSYCMGYNTEKFKKEDMPKTWDDLVNTEAFKGGKLGLNVNYTVYLPYLVKKNGMEWGTQFMDKLFAMEPQKRREGLQMLSKLTGLGEFDLAIPQADKQVAFAVKEGATVAWHCAEPVPLSFTKVAIIKGTPKLYSAKIFLNWLLSREAQLAEFHASFARPAHKDLFETYAVYPEETAGKEFVIQDEESVKLSAELAKPWGERFGK